MCKKTLARPYESNTRTLFSLFFYRLHPENRLIVFVRFAKLTKPIGVRPRESSLAKHGNKHMTSLRSTEISAGHMFERKSSPRMNAHYQ